MAFNRNWRRLGGAALRGGLTAVFLVAAGMKFAAVPFEVAGFARFGYPLWFMYVIGVLQLLGAALLWARGFVGFGAAMLAVLMAGAIYSHLRAGDPAFMPVPALVLFACLAGLAYARRGEMRPVARLRQAPLTVLFALVGGHVVLTSLIPLLAAAARL